MHATTPLRSDVPLQWPEAAALVQKIANAVADGRLEGVPPFAWLALDAQGAIHVRPTSSGGALRRGDGVATASALGELFHQFVGNNPVPPQLDAALQSTNDGTKIDSADAFSRAIGFFVRPTSDKDLRALAARLQELNEEVRLQGEIEALTRHARAADEHAPEGLQPAAAAAKRRLSRRLMIVASLACGVLALLVLGLGRFQALRAATPVLDKGSALVKDAARVVFGGQETVAAVPPPPTAVTTNQSSPRRARPRPRLRTSGPTVSIDNVTPIPGPAPSLPASMLIPPALRIAPAATEPSPEGLVFDAEDTEVRPAVLMRPHLPSRASLGNPPREFSRLEMVVSETGEVERVRLLATSVERRYYDAMLLPAVKAWVFAPARRNGLPVRYRLQVLLTN